MMLYHHDFPMEVSVLIKGFRPPTPKERAKYRAAQEAGLLERVMEVGWAGLTAKETGRIGGLVGHKKRQY